MYSVGLSPREALSSALFVLFSFSCSSALPCCCLWVIEMQNKTERYPLSAPPIIYKSLFTFKSRPPGRIYLQASAEFTKIGNLLLSRRVFRVKAHHAPQSKSLISFVDGGTIAREHSITAKVLDDLAIALESGSSSTNLLANQTCQS